MNAAPTPAPAAATNGLGLVTLSVEFKTNSGPLHTLNFRVPTDMSARVAKMYLSEAISKRLNYDELVKALGLT